MDDWKLDYFTWCANRRFLADYFSGDLLPWFGFLEDDNALIGRILNTIRVINRNLEVVIFFHNFLFMLVSNHFDRHGFLKHVIRATS